MRQDRSRVEELSAKGTDAFRAGRYKEAIGAFEQAYAITPVANLLYNIALCYEKLDDLDNAHAYYKRFIVAPDANADVRSTALARMDERRLILAALSQLSVAEQTMIELRYWEELSMAEIAGVMEMGVEAVKTRIHRARKKLRPLLEREARSPEERDSTRSPRGSAAS